jgi:hypothetical protein
MRGYGVVYISYATGIHKELTSGNQSVMNIRIEEMQLEMLNLLQLYTRLPSDVVKIIYQFIMGCIAQIYPPHSVLTDIGLTYAIYSSDDKMREFIAKNRLDLEYVETIDFTNRSIFEL